MAPSGVADGRYTQGRTGWGHTRWGDADAGGGGAHFRSSLPETLFHCQTQLGQKFGQLRFRSVLVNSVRLSSCLFGNPSWSHRCERFDTFKATGPIHGSPKLSNDQFQGAMPDVARIRLRSCQCRALRRNGKPLKAPCKRVCTAWTSPWHCLSRPASGLADECDMCATLGAERAPDSAAYDDERSAVTDSKQLRQRLPSAVLFHCFFDFSARLTAA